MMVVLQITSDCSALEWIMFELQGDVERRVGQISGEDFEIGTATFCNTVSKTPHAPHLEV